MRKKIDEPTPKQWTDKQKVRDFETFSPKWSLPSKICPQGSENPAEEETECRWGPNRMEDTRKQGLWKQHGWHTYEHIWTPRVCGNMGRSAQGKADWISELRGKVNPKSYTKPELNSNWQLLAKIRLVFSNEVSPSIQTIIHPSMAHPMLSTRCSKQTQ